MAVATARLNVSRSLSANESADLPSISFASPTARCANVFFSGPGAASGSKLPAEFTKHNPLHACGCVLAANNAANAPIEFPTMIVLSVSDAPATSFVKSTTCWPQNSMQYSSSTLGDQPYPNMHSAYTRYPARASAGIVYLQ